MHCENMLLSQHITLGEITWTLTNLSLPTANMKRDEKEAAELKAKIEAKIKK